MRRYFQLSGLAVGLSVLVCSCGKKEQLPENLSPKQQAEHVLGNAKGAWEKKDADAATQAAMDMESILDQSEERIAKLEHQLAAERELRRELKALRRKSSWFTDMTEEHQRLQGLQNGWKSKGYGLIRKTLVKAVTKGMSLAVKHGGEKGYEQLSDEDQEKLQLATFLTDDFKTDEGEPDWDELAKAVDQLEQGHGDELSLFLCVILVAARKDNLALLEMKYHDSGNIKKEEFQIGARIFDGVVYRVNGFPRHGNQCFEEAAATREDIVALSMLPHMMMAWSAYENKDYEGVDLAIMQMNKVSPNNPVAVILTGEKMVAEGEYEKAACNLEDIAKDKKIDPWLIQKIQERAREIRDKKGEAEPLLHDSTFFRNVVLHYAIKTLKEARLGDKVLVLYEKSKSYAENMVKDLKLSERLDQMKDEVKKQVEKAEDKLQMKKDDTE